MTHMENKQRKDLTVKLKIHIEDDGMKIFKNV